MASIVQYVGVGVSTTSTSFQVTIQFRVQFELILFSCNNTYDVHTCAHVNWYTNFIFESHMFVCSDGYSATFIFSLVFIAFLRSHVIIFSQVHCTVIVPPWFLITCDGSAVTVQSGPEGVVTSYISIFHVFLSENI